MNKALLTLFQKHRSFCCHTVLLVLNLCSMASTAAATEHGTSDTPDNAPQEQYHIEQPGTITFTVGVKIRGKVEKPQVIIFLPKEKTLYRDEQLNHSFTEDLADPLPFTPITE